MNYAIIMAGGAGTRFWPLSTEEKPKQFLDILGTGKTFLQMTVERFAGIVPKENVYIVTNEKYKPIITEQIPGILDDQIICEPNRNNTAPCILLAALKIQKKDPDACCVFVPADHLILNTTAYQQNIVKALDYAAKNKAVLTIGVKPNRPETGYGYIKMDDSDETEIKKVDQFVEKPNADTAKEYLASGKYLWNAGMFAWHVSTIEQEYKLHADQIYQVLAKGVNKYNTPAEKEFLLNNYSTTENISVDFAIMEKSNCVYSLAADFDWTDLGIWSSVIESSQKEDDGNVVIGDKILIENGINNLVILPKGKKAIVHGLNSMIVVDSEEGLLIYPRSEEHKIKSSVQKIH